MDAKLVSAASDTLSRISRHEAAAEPVVAEVLAEIKANFLESSFSAADLELAEPLYKTMRAFRAATGHSPFDYISLSRLMVAARLLCETELKHQPIAELVGFEDKNELRNYCRTHFGCNPGRLRSLARAARRAGREPCPTLSGYRRWLAGELTSREVEEMVNRREQIEEELGRSTSVSRPMFRLSKTAVVLDQQIEMLFGYPREQRLRLLRRCVYRGSIEAFEALSMRSREEGRENRERGLELAEMALAAVEGIHEELGEHEADYLALGWARLGNARRLASDLEGAERAIRQAETSAEKATEQDRVLAEVLRYKGTLRVFQRRFAEALAIYDEAVTLGQAAGAELAIVDNLLQRASVHLYLGKAAEALPDIEKARLLIPDGDERRRLGVVQHGMDAAILAGEPELAREILPEARRLSLEVDDRSLSLQIRWLEGWLLRAEGELEAAEPLLKEARAGFISLQDLGTSAIVSLDLALLYHQQGGRAGEVRSYASDALPALRALNLPEAHGAIALLHDALRERRLHRGVLNLARHRLLAPGAR